MHGAIHGYLFVIIDITTAVLRARTDLVRYHSFLLGCLTNPLRCRRFLVRHRTVELYARTDLLRYRSFLLRCLTNSLRCRRFLVRYRTTELRFRTQAVRLHALLFILHFFPMNR